MNIRKHTIAIAVLLNSFFCAISQENNFLAEWQRLDNFKLSNNGNWAAVYNIDENRAKANLSIINTTTLSKKSMGNLQIIGVIGDFLIHYKEKNVILCENLKTSIISHHVIKRQIDLLEKNNRLVFISESGALNLYSTDKATLQQLAAIKDVQKYYINPKQDIVIAVTESNVIKVIDVNSLKVKSLKIPDQKIQSVFWSDDKDFVLRLENEQLVLIDYILAKSVHIPIVIDKEPNTIITPVFLSNGNLIINTMQKIDSVSKDSGYLDIWNGNSKDLENKNNVNNNTRILSKSYLFDKTSEQIRNIHIPSHLAPLFTKTPNFTLLYDDQKYKDYTTYVPKIELSIYDTSTESLNPVVDSLLFFNKYLSYSADGRYLSYIKDNHLYIYDSNLNLTTEVSYLETAVDIVWSTDSQFAYIISKKEILKLDLRDYVLKRIFCTISTSSIQLLNKETTAMGINQGNGLIPSYVNPEQKKLFKVLDLENNTNSLLLLEDNIATTIYSTTNRVSQIIWNQNLSTITFAEENYNSPPKIQQIKNKKVSLVFENPMSKDLYDWRKQEVVKFRNGLNNNLRGILYYPKGYDPNGLYPMVVSIYEKQFFKQNTFYFLSVTESTGFNIPLMTSLGYFVFLPDTEINESGPAVSALNCVNNAVKEVLKKEPAINRNKIGIIGNSYGGYLVNYIITQTDVFSAAVSGVAVSDIIWDYYSYNYNFPKPSYYKYENGQYGMNVSFSQSPALYLANNPLLYVQNIQTPVLLFTGLKDYNVHWENTRHFYM